MHDSELKWPFFFNPETSISSKLSSGLPSGISVTMEVDEILRKLHLAKQHDRALTARLGGHRPNISPAAAT